MIWGSDNASRDLMLCAKAHTEQARLRYLDEQLLGPDRHGILWYR